jgi:hypothetical protein
MDQTEKHFQIMIYLMLVFFCVDMGFEIAQGLKILSAPIAINTAHDAFLTFFGIAVGMFRGMVPQGSLTGQSLKDTTTTTDIQVHSEKDK